MALSRVIAVLAAAAVCPVASAQFWVGPPVGSWGNPANWSTGEVPDNVFGPFTDSATIGPGFFVTMDFGGLFTPPTNVTFLNLGAGSTLNIIPDQRLAITTGPVTSAGTIMITATFPAAADLDIAGGATLTGPGEVVLSGNRAFLSGNTPSSPVTIAAGATVRGSGDIGGSAITVVNNGLIDADDPAGRLVFSALPSDPNLNVNTGTMQASGGGELFFTGSFGRVLDNTTGLIQALDGSTVTISGQQRIVGGVVQSVGTGRVVASATNTGAILIGCEINGDLDVEAGGGTLRLSDPTVNNATITIVGPTGSLQVLGDVDLTGTGEFVISGLPTTRVGSTGLGDRLIQGPLHTIRGGGSLGENVMDLTNHGLILADNPAVPLHLNPRDATGPSVNTGELVAAPGCRLRINDLTLENAGGVIRADDGGVVEITGATVRDGTLETFGTGIIECTSSVTFRDIVNNGDFILRDPVSLQQVVVEGTIENNGTMTWEANVGGAHRLSIADGTNVLFSGTGEFIAQPGGNAQVIFGDLTNGPNHTFRGPWAMGASFALGDVVNNGTFLADTAQAFLLTADRFTNNGDITIPAGGTFRVREMFRETFWANAGTIDIAPGGTLDLSPKPEDLVQTAGVTTVHGLIDMHPNGGEFLLQGGTLRGTGELDEDIVASAGTVAPGASAGTLTVGQTYTQFGSAVLSLELAGTATGTEHDTLEVGAAASLGGDIEVTLLGSYVPDPADTFIVLNADSLTGAFSNAVPDGSGRAAGIVTGNAEFDVVYDEVLAQVRLENVALANPCNSADIVRPFGVLDVSDVIAFLDAFAASDPAADLAPPAGVFDIDDVLAYLAVFSGGC